MFTQKKKNFFKTKTFLALVLLSLAAFGLWMNHDPEENKAANVNTKTEQAGNTETEDDHQENKSENDESSSSETKSKAYYLVKEVDGIIKVFHFNKDGEKILFMTTSIPFDVIGYEDQKLLSRGIVLKSRSELDSFLENFDS